MPGDFDFDFDADDKPSRGPSQEAKRAMAPSWISLSISGFVMLGGGVLAVIAWFLPAGDSGQVGEIYGGTRVIWWGLFAMAVGGACIPIRVTSYPGLLDYAWSALGVLFGLIPAGLLVLSGIALESVVKLGIGGYVVFLSAPVIVLGSFLRFGELIWRCRNAQETPQHRQRDEEDEDEPPRKPRRRKRNEEEDGDKPPRRASSRKRDEPKDDEDAEPRRRRDRDRDRDREEEPPRKPRRRDRDDDE